MTGTGPAVVLDANVLVSATLSRLGKPAECMRLIEQGRVQSVTCWAILEEFGLKLRAKFAFPMPRVRKAVDKVEQHSTLIQIDHTLHVVVDDPDDDEVLECALAGEARYVVTGDHHLLGMERYRDIAIVTPADFLAAVANR
jgi:putative PIN family toxin of toxin-antitoxin system